jgi:hypothetical protein
MMMNPFAKFRKFLAVLLIVLANIFVVQGIEAQVLPHNLSVDSLTLMAEWDVPRDILINEDFESGIFPPLGWQALTQSITGWFTSINGGSANFVIPPHTTYAVSNDDLDNWNGCCDYLITPLMDWRNQSTYFLHFSSYFHGAYSQQAFIEISTDGGASWIIINTLPLNFYSWQEIEIDLSIYSGSNGLENVLLAFHSDDNGEWASGWAIDDVMISSAPILPLGYTVFLDDIAIDNTNETNYTYQHLVFGQEYLTGVAAIYSSGLSETDTFRFVSRFLYPPLNLQGSMPGGTDYNHLTWNHPYNGETGDNLPAGILGYNIYRNNLALAFIEYPENEYFDFNINPGFYAYHVTAVYDLSAYGYPGETSESMVEGPIQSDFICCYYLPFIEEFNTGSFETNEWTADPGNWRIAGTSGNDAPSATFYHSPAVTNYAQSLTSAFIIGTDLIDGDIIFDYDIKLNTLNATGTEFLAVEVLKDSNWVEIAKYSNTASFDWENKSIPVTSVTKGTLFQVRFRAYGTNSQDIDNWQVDNIRIYRECKAPTELTYYTIVQNLNEYVVLSWQEPFIVDHNWLAWDNGGHYGALDLIGLGAFSVASRFTANQLLNYLGSCLTQIRFFPVSPGEAITIKVWRGENAGELLLTQPLDSYNPGMWNEVVLDIPVLIVPNQELWFGYTITHGNEPVAGLDSGPAVAGFGDMISIDGIEWASLRTGYGKNCNWNLQGCVDNTFPANSGQLSLFHHALPGLYLNKPERNLTGYNIYRDDVLIGTSTIPKYYDPLPALSESRCYKVTAVYEDCESDFSEEVWYYGIDISTDLIKSANKIYPNPSGDVVNLELTSDIKQLIVYNNIGQVIYEQEIAGDKNVQLDVKTYKQGLYLLKLITHNGERIDKKITVVR